ncbi:MAG: long-chain fatty acid--CoA ligase [Pseudomonadota bacterium]
MHGQMMNFPLTIASLVDHAARYHGATEIWSVETAGGVTETTWAEVAANSRRLGHALEQLGLGEQARCGTIAWNNRRHLEIYFGVSGAGFVCHTINPRLFPEQLIYIINHAEDRVLFIDRTFVPLVKAIRDKIEGVEYIVLMEGRDDALAGEIEGLVFYDDLIARGSPDYEWPPLDELTASSLCYTSGTTGHPKGVLYSHRSTVLHALASNTPDCIGFSARDVIMPVVPMFHVNAWGVPYAAAQVGARMVMPGPGLDGPSLVGLIDTYGVSIALGVPTIWAGLLGAAEAAGSQLATLKRTVVGGSACPPSMIKTFRERYDVELIHAWGMSEMSPLGTTNQPLAKHASLPVEAQHALRESQGRPPWGIEMKIVDPDGAPLPEDGEAQGDLMVRGPWVLSNYFRKSMESTLTDGWFHTGDVAVIDADGYLSIKDRSKDIIKSGGEWISSVDLENIALGHAALADAAVIGARHEKWDERPVLIAVPAEGQSPSEADVLAIFDGQVAKWQVPDKVIFVDALPRNATGKVLKRDLREAHGEVLVGAG